MRGKRELDALKREMRETRPACAGDHRFTADEATAGEQIVMLRKCRACPLLELCGAYARAAHPAEIVGYWAGVTYPRPNGRPRNTKEGK